MVRGLGRSGGNDGVVELGNPGLLVFPRLEAAALQEIIGVFIPLSIGKIVA
jgi:hypothetical protein